MNIQTHIIMLITVIVFLVNQLLAVEPPLLQDVSWHYTDKGITSTIHKQHVKQIVWSKSEIAFSNQESNVLDNRFNLTDPIYGRIYLERSVRNTPVYSSVSDEPLENSRNGYQVKLYIDGKDTGGSFGVFDEGELNDEVGQTWTTWQFIPHPSSAPEYPDEKKVAAAWEKAVRGLAVGEHDVRFELWGVLGQQRSKEALAQGTFILVVSKGESVATVSKFPEQTYSGNDAAKLGEQLKQALAQNGVASLSEISKLSITSDWSYSRYTDTKIEYRKISAAVLFSDKDNDGICRFVTYNFISDKNDNGWTVPRFHSFCNGCPEGDVNCPK